MRLSQPQRAAGTVHLAAGKRWPDKQSSGGMVLAASQLEDNLEQPQSSSQFEELFDSPYPFHGSLQGKRKAKVSSPEQQVKKVGRRGSGKSCRWGE